MRIYIRTNQLVIDGSPSSQGTIPLAELAKALQPYLSQEMKPDGGYFFVGNRDPSDPLHEKIKEFNEEFKAEPKKTVTYEIPYVYCHHCHKRIRKNLFKKHLKVKHRL